MKIGYFADGKWGINSFRKLNEIENLNIEFICGRYSLPDKALRTLADKNNIPFLTSNDINSQHFEDKLSEFKCDLFISMSFDQIMKKNIFNLPKYGSINCHAGKLPSYRGRNVLNWVLINDEKDFGITVHFIDNGIDTGEIIKQRIFPIDDSDSYLTLLKKSYEECPKILFEAVKDIMENKVIKKAQELSSYPSIYCVRRGAGDELINWQETSREIFNFVRALTYPGPCASTNFHDSIMKITQVEYLPFAHKYKGIPGSALSIDGENFTVKTKDSFLKVVKWECDKKPKVGSRFLS